MENGNAAPPEWVDKCECRRQGSACIVVRIQNSTEHFLEALAATHLYLKVRWRVKIVDNLPENTGSFLVLLDEHEANRCFDLGVLLKGHTERNYWRAILAF